MAVKAYKDDQLLDKVKSLSNYKEIPKGYWLLGVRSNEDTPNIFDDKIYLFKGEEFILVTSATTNPGTPTLKQFEKVNKAGAAVLKSDVWYYNLWKYGRHNGKIEALLQIGNSVQVYRDKDKDSKAEEQGELQTGYFGINFHPNTYNITADNTGATIGWFSAGCQVVNDMDKYREMIKLLKTEKAVSYCLLKEF
jgi:hypothetical protein